MIYIGNLAGMYIKRKKRERQRKERGRLREKQWIEEEKERQIDKEEPGAPKRIEKNGKE